MSSRYNKKTAANRKSTERGRKENTEQARDKNTRLTNVESAWTKNDKALKKKMFEDYIKYLIRLIDSIEYLRSAVRGVPYNKQLKANATIRFAEIDDDNKKQNARERNAIAAIRTYYLTIEDRDVTDDEIVRSVSVKRDTTLSRSDLARIKEYYYLAMMLLKKINTVSAKRKNTNINIDVYREDFFDILTRAAKSLGIKFDRNVREARTLPRSDAVAILQLYFKQNLAVREGKGLTTQYEPDNLIGELLSLTIKKKKQLTGYRITSPQGILKLTSHPKDSASPPISVAENVNAFYEQCRLFLRNVRDAYNGKDVALDDAEQETLNQLQIVVKRGGLKDVKVKTKDGIRVKDIDEVITAAFTKPKKNINQIIQPYDLNSLIPTFSQKRMYEINDDIVPSINTIKKQIADLKPAKK